MQTGALMAGQLTVIAGRTGYVWISWQRVGRELNSLENLRNEWRGDAKVTAVIEMNWEEAVETLMGLLDDGYWVEGQMYLRTSLVKLAEHVAANCNHEKELENA